jgi:hypothetical protein
MSLLKQKIFVSYCHKNKDEVYQLTNELRKYGFNLWIDHNEMTSGNIEKLIQKGIDQSKLFICCATSSYCKSEMCLLEFNYSVYKKKKIIYILFERFSGNEERLEKLDEIAFRFAGQMFYKNEDVKGIVIALKVFFVKTLEEIIFILFFNRMHYLIQSFMKIPLNYMNLKSIKIFFNEY